MLCCMASRCIKLCRVLPCYVLPCHGMTCCSMCSLCLLCFTKTCRRMVLHTGYPGVHRGTQGYTWVYHLMLHNEPPFCLCNLRCQGLAFTTLCCALCCAAQLSGCHNAPGRSYMQQHMCICSSPDTSHSYMNMQLCSWPHAVECEFKSTYA